MLCLPMHTVLQREMRFKRRALRIYFIAFYGFCRRAIGFIRVGGRRGGRTGRVQRRFKTLGSERLSTEALQQGASAAACDAIDATNAVVVL